MPHLDVTLFGGFQVALDGKPLTPFRTDKNRALLAYLALESDRRHRREALAALLWPAKPKSAARNSLRQALFHLRHLLPEGPDDAPYLIITNKQVQFNPTSDHWIDVVEFNSLVSACRAHNSEDSQLGAVCLERLRRAVALYEGEMLEGLTLPWCVQFTEWQIFTQQECHCQALTALSLLTDYFEANRRYGELLACTRQKIRLEPWRESAYRRQMWALAMTGRREEALLQYELLCRVLQAEIGIPPTARTTRLYDAIRDGALPRQRPV